MTSRTSRSRRRRHSGIAVTSRTSTVRLKAPLGTILASSTRLIQGLGRDVHRADKTGEYASMHRAPVILGTLVVAKADG